MLTNLNKFGSNNKLLRQYHKNWTNQRAKIFSPIFCPNNVCTLCSQNVCTICSENVCSTCSADYCKFLFTCSLLLLVNCLLPQLIVCSGKSKVGILGKCFKRYYNSIKQKPPNSHPDWDSVNMTVNFRAPFYSKAAGNGKGIYNSLLIRWFVHLSRWMVAWTLYT